MGQHRMGTGGSLAKTQCREPGVLLPATTHIPREPRAVHQCGCATTQGAGQRLLLRVPGRQRRPESARPSGGGGPLRGQHPLARGSGRLGHPAGHKHLRQRREPAASNTSHQGCGVSARPGRVQGFVLGSLLGVKTFPEGMVYAKPHPNSRVCQHTAILLASHR